MYLFLRHVVYFLVLLLFLYVISNTLRVVEYLSNILQFTCIGCSFKCLLKVEESIVDAPRIMDPGSDV
jgi:hypothetical protein